VSGRAQQVRLRQCGIIAEVDSLLSVAEKRIHHAAQEKGCAVT
jgi:hypothetical protein